VLSNDNLYYIILVNQEHLIYNMDNLITLINLKSPIKQQIIR